tara:strand:+ start:236 stop:535 length:300 start_codon:yes stop_codon:yes gene_type:complete
VAVDTSGNLDFPFMEEYACDKGIVRTFDPERDDSEYVWHRDHEDREIEVLSGEGWQFQYEGCLPYLLEKGMIFDIAKGEFHRLVRGVTALKCRIIKKNG